MHAVDGTRVAPGEELGDRLVGGQHELLDQAVRRAFEALLGGHELAPGVEAVLRLERADLQRAAREARGAQLAGQLGGQPQMSAEGLVAGRRGGRRRTVACARRVRP